MINQKFLWTIYLHRPYWRCYFPNTQAIIYVVDSSDVDRLVTAKDEFHAILDVSVIFVSDYEICLFSSYKSTISRTVRMSDNDGGGNWKMTCVMLPCFSE